MRILIIRHGDPNYAIDSLTEKGWREAELLADRLEKEKIDYFYSSPLGRAKDTAGCTLKRVGKEAQVFDWLQEFYYPITDPLNPENTRIAWDFMPGYWTQKEQMYDKDNWAKTDIFTGSQLAEKQQMVYENLDTLLAKHGYVRKGRYYEVKERNTDTIAIFCHLGVEFVMLSHLLGVSAPVLWQGCFVAPTSVTVLTTEERVKGEACFRCKTIGDTGHLYIAGEPASDSGFFQEVWTEEK
jgi:probable phosphoglycerate mutase